MAVFPPGGARPLPQDPTSLACSRLCPGVCGIPLTEQGGGGPPHAPFFVLGPVADWGAQHTPLVLASRACWREGGFPERVGPSLGLPHWPELLPTGAGDPSRPHPGSQGSSPFWVMWVCTLVCEPGRGCVCATALGNRGAGVLEPPRGRGSSICAAGAPARESWQQRWPRGSSLLSPCPACQPLPTLLKTPAASLHGEPTVSRCLVSVTWSRQPRVDIPGGCGRP